MAADDEKHLLRSGRKIDSADASVISSMVDAGFEAKTFSYLANEKGGETKVQFTLEDLNNHIRTKKKTQLKAGDAQSLVNHFCNEQQNDPMFFYSVQLDDDGHMTNFFWRDGRSLIDYESFGDVLIFDSTYRTNMYGMICAPFTGINHHKNVVIGCAFLLDETTETFVWLFKTFLKAMGNRHPITIFTDQSQAMTNVIKEEIFTKCVYGCRSELEFEEIWFKMIVDYDITDHKWLKRLYDLRQKWCPVFSLDIFSAGVRSTQRSESTNSVIRKMSCKTMTLSRLVHHVQKVAERWRSKERKLAFRCRMGKPVYAARDSGILRQADEVYTLAIFDEFKREFYDTLHLVAKGYSQDGDHYVHVLQQETKTVDFVVKFNPLCGSVTCSCKNFESKGLLCCHVLKVLNLHGVSVITSNYILKRWTKDVKKGAKQVGSNSLNDGTSKLSVTLARNYLLHKAYKAINQSVLDGNGVKIAEKYLSAWVKEIENHVADINISSDDSSNSDDDRNGDIDSDRNHTLQVKNPTKRRPVGESNVRLKGALEKRKKSTNRENAHLTFSLIVKPKGRNGSVSISNKNLKRLRITLDMSWIRGDIEVIIDAPILEHLRFSADSPLVSMWMFNSISNLKSLDVSGGPTTNLIGDGPTDSIFPKMTHLRLSVSSSEVLQAMFKQQMLHFPGLLEVPQFYSF
ncbi:protein FAR1-RELATED SEQUENCE 5-like [Silene latifolia]|uniref:protein FAR1-RELATED SEQUENCE 5-like n=1 Tax=Silene latifolia TaxID=37657 RepID=UPI003D76CB8E